MMTSVDNTSMMLLNFPDDQFYPRWGFVVGMQVCIVSSLYGYVYTVFVICRYQVSRFQKVDRSETFYKEPSVAAMHRGYHNKPAELDRTALNAV